jgi:hypothetical protein
MKTKKLLAARAGVALNAARSFAKAENVRRSMFIQVGSDGTSRAPEVARGREARVLAKRSPFTVSCRLIHLRQEISRVSTKDFRAGGVRD